MCVWLTHRQAINLASRGKPIWTRQTFARSLMVDVQFKSCTHTVCGGVWKTNLINSVSFFVSKMSHLWHPPRGVTTSTQTQHLSLQVQLLTANESVRTLFPLACLEDIQKGKKPLKLYHNNWQLIPKQYNLFFFNLQNTKLLFVLQKKSTQLLDSFNRTNSLTRLTLCWKGSAWCTQTPENRPSWD